MPIYEHYCKSCHTIYSFFSQRVDREVKPDCPRCGRAELPRRPSRFATLKHQGEDGERDPLDDLDDSRLEGAMDTLMREMGQMGDSGEEDPRAVGRMMRRFGELTGLEIGGAMEEYITRLEGGADPESLENEMENAFGDDEATFDDLFKIKKAMQRQRDRPRVDDKLYFL